MVFLGKDVELHCRPGYGRMEIGRWVHIGDGNAIRCHEGSLRIGDKAVFGRQNVINCYLDIELGAATLVADWVYICDFDHVTADIASADQRPGHREVAGAHRPGQLDRHQGVGVAWHADRARVRARRARRRARATSRTTRSRSARRHAWCATAWPTTKQTRSAGRRWRTWHAKPTRRCARPSKADGKQSGSG